MPKKISESEKEYITKKLKKEAMKSLSLYGIKKTTVDELVKRVNIPKGTFYLFYESKELLFFDAINDLHDQMQEKLLQDMAVLQGKVSVDRMTDFLFELFKEVNRTGLLTVILSGEIDILMRKLPEEVVKEHLAKDDFSFEQLLSFLPCKENLNINAFSGAFRGVFLTMLYQREIGEEIFEDAMKLMIRGLVIQMLEETEND